MTPGQDILDAIRQVLIRDWDPIGVMDDPEWPRDEYDAYLLDLHRMLERDEPAEFIARHLCWIEVQMMGREAVPESRRLPLAHELKAIVAPRRQ